MTDARPRLHLDFETRSAAPFGRQKDAVTVRQYAQHPTTDIWLLRYAVDSGPIRGWNPWNGHPLPADLMRHVRTGTVVCAHNATFEWTLWNEILVKRYGAHPLPFEQMDDTAVRAAIMALPRSLEEACSAMGVSVQKDMAGSRLMMRMAKPRKIHRIDDGAFEGETWVPAWSDEHWAAFIEDAHMEPRRYTVLDDQPDTIYEWWADNDRFDRLGQYCDTDVEAERALDSVLIMVPEINQRDLLLTHTTNQRGVTVDVPLAQAAKAVMAHVDAQYREEMQAITNGAVRAHTEVAAMRAWLSEQGHDTPSLDKAHVAALLENPGVEGPSRRLLEIRQAAGKSSVAKLDRFVQLTTEEGVMVENFMYHGAATGRLAGKGAQLQNLPSREGLRWQQAEQAAQLILDYEGDPEGTAEVLELLFGDVPLVMSSLLRGHIIAPEGKALYVADFSNIEGRAAAWLAEEEWKLRAFRDFDAGIGPDLYKVTAGQILGKTTDDVSDEERNVMGKVPELALGFGGGVGAFQSMANIYRVDMAEHWPVVQKTLGAQVIERAHDHWSLFGERSGLDHETWLASEAVKIAWRDKHPAIVKCWADCGHNAEKALREPGRWHRFANGKLAFASKKYGDVNFLIGRLPSGRAWFKAHARLNEIERFGRQAFEIRFMGVDSITRRWVPMSTYPGDLFQSFVQAAAFDMMMHGWHNVEQDGFEVVLSVHDELGALGEPGIPFDKFKDSMSNMPSWADGCPVTARGYKSRRYRKD